MDEESVLETEVQTVPPTESITETVETEASETGDWTVAIETEPEETEVFLDSESVDLTVASDSVPIVTESVIYGDDTTASTEEAVLIDVIQQVGVDIAHCSLFSGFLVCGTLIGIALLRKIYGT